MSRLTTGSVLHRHKNATALSIIAIPFVAVGFIQSTLLMPIVDGDSLHFFIPAAEYAINNTLRNPYLTYLNANEHSSFYHGWLYPVLLALGAHFGGYKGLFIANYAIYLVGTILFIGLCVVFSRRHLLFSAACFLVALSFFFPDKFRPELLAWVIICGAIVSLNVLNSWNQRWKEFAIVSGSMALLGVTHPVGTLLAGACYACHKIYHDGRRGVLDIALVGILGCLGVFIITELVMGNFYGWIERLIEQAHYSAVRKDGDYLPYYITDPAGPLAGGPLLSASLAFATFGAAKIYQLKSKADQILGATVTFASLGLAYYVGPRVPPIIYNLKLIAPLILIILCPVIMNVTPRIGKWLMVSTIIFVVGPLIGLVRSIVIVVFALVSPDAVRYDQLQKRIVELSDEISTPVAIDVSFVAVLPHFREKNDFAVINTTAFVSGKTTGELVGEDNANVACVAVIKQANTGLTKAARVDGFHVVEDRFAARVQFWSITILRTPKTYNYAVYQRDRPDCV